MLGDVDDDGLLSNDGHEKTSGVCSVVSLNNKSKMELDPLEDGVSVAS